MPQQEQGPDFPKLPPEVRLPVVDLRQVCPVLQEMIEFLEKWSPESYDGYYLGCALALISIISARRVQYEFGGTRSTSLYIILVGSTGISAKTTVMSLVQDILNELDLGFFLFPDTITAQKFLSEMCIQVPDDYEDRDEPYKKNILLKVQKKQVFAGQRGWIFDELGELFREMMQSMHHNSNFRELLKKLDDIKPILATSTQKRGKETVHLPFLTLLGGMTPVDLSPYAKSRSALWRDGLLARMAFICPPPDFSKNQPFPEGERIIPDSIVKQLSEWHTRLGIPKIELTPDFRFIPAVGQTYEIPKDVRGAFYAYRRALKDIIRDSDEPDLAGNYIRYPELAMRIAVLMASFNNEEAITMDYWGFAQNVTEQWRNDLHRLYYQSLPDNKSPTSLVKKSPEDKVYDIILVRGPITARGIQQQTAIKTDFVGEIISMLVEQGRIIAVPDGKTTLYQIKQLNCDV
jgi:hypothetical protein